MPEATFSDTQAPKYWAFLSYSQRDKTWSDWLRRAIENYRVPRRLVGRQSRDGAVPRRLFSVFRDQEELPASANLGSNNEEALRASRYLIVVCSPNGAASRWVNEEIRAFKAMGREDRVLAIIVSRPGLVQGNPVSLAIAERAPSLFPGYYQRDRGCAEEPLWRSGPARSAAGDCRPSPGLINKLAFS